MNGSRQVLVEPDEGHAVALLTEILSTIACEAVAQRERFTLSLAGGTTPRRLYEHLTSPENVEKIPWPETFIFFGDERDVPHGDPNSNYRMAEETLLSAVPVPFEQVFPMPADVADLDAAAEHYAQRIREVVPAQEGGIPCFDLILLGVGGDGHTASLFPETPALEETQRLIVAQNVPAIGRKRITFTYPLINAARNVAFLVTGMDKAEVLQGVLSPDEQVARQLPAGRVRPRGQTYFVLDRDAASRVPPQIRAGGPS